MTTIPDSDAYQLHRRIHLSRPDLRDAYTFAELLESLGEIDPYDPRAKAYTIAAVVSYCRPFTGNRQESDGDLTLTRLPEDLVLDSLTPKERAFHDHIKTLRDTVFAHADPGPRSLTFGKVADPASEFPEMIAVQIEPTKALSHLDAQNLIRLIKKLGARLARLEKETEDELGRLHSP